MWGAKGAINAARGSSTARLRQPPNSLRHIMNADTEVLNEKFSISSRTFLMVLWSVFSSAAAGRSSVSASLPSRSK